MQALNLASMNIASLAIIGVGGTMWAFDISGLKEAQTALRRRLNYDTIYQGGEAVPESLGDLLKASREITTQEDNENGKRETPR
jgi:hypothetical protein